MSASRLFCLMLLGILPGLSGCKIGPSFGGPPPPPGPTPSISSISPSSATAGAPGFTLTVNGSNFTSGALVGWRNPDNPGTFGRSTTFVSATQLTVQVSAADIAIPSSVQVSVVLTGASASNTVTFVINPGHPGGAQPISTGANGATPNGASHDPMLSFNGRFVAFASEATNLIAGGTKFPEGYVRDTCLGVDQCIPTTLLASAVTGGTPAGPVEGNAQGGATPSIGAQFFSPPSSGIPPAGEFIGFLSTATNLVTPNTALQQAYVRDTCFGARALPGCTPATVLASVTQNGGEPNGATSAFIFSANLCSAAFVSAGTNVVGGVTTPNEVYLSSCAASGVRGGFTTSGNLVSADNAGIAANQGAQQPAMSFDGRFVAFASTSSNLPGAPAGGVQQIYVRDTCAAPATACAPSTTLVSVDASGNPFTGSSQLPAISDDGRFVVFSTQVAPPAGSTVSVRDTCNSSSGPVASCTPSTTTISVATGSGGANGPSSSTSHAVSGDGRFVVFSSSATNLIAGGNPAAQVFVRDSCKSSSGSVSGCTASTVLVSVNSTGPTGGFGAAISNDGHFVVFQTTIGGVQQILFAATGF